MRYNWLLRKRRTRRQVSANDRLQDGQLAVVRNPLSPSPAPTSWPRCKPL